MLVVMPNIHTTPSPRMQRHFRPLNIADAGEGGSTPRSPATYCNAKFWFRSASKMPLITPKALARHYTRQWPEQRHLGRERDSPLLPRSAPLSTHMSFIGVKQADQTVYIYHKRSAHSSEGLIGRFVTQLSHFSFQKKKVQGVGNPSGEGMRGNESPLSHWGGEEGVASKPL